METYKKVQRDKPSGTSGCGCSAGELNTQGDGKSRFSATESSLHVSIAANTASAVFAAIHGQCFSRWPFIMEQTFDSAPH